MPKKKESTGIPKYVLHQLIEHTPGGFLLFSFNHTTGFPEHLMTFDSPAFCLAMIKYISDWSKAVDKMHVIVAGNNVGNIIIANDETPDDSDDDAPTDIKVN